MLTPAGTEGLLYQGENGAFSLIECESEIGWPGSEAWEKGLGTGELEFGEIWSSLG